MAKAPPKRDFKAYPIGYLHVDVAEVRTEQGNLYLLVAYNHAKRLKTLRGLTPYEFVCVQHQKNMDIFTRDPTQLILGLYT